MDELAVEIGKLIRLHRERFGISQKELMAKVGLHKSTLSHIELGENMPRFGTVIALADALDIGVQSFVPRMVKAPASVALKGRRPAKRAERKG